MMKCLFCTHFRPLGQNPSKNSFFRRIEDTTICFLRFSNLYHCCSIFLSLILIISDHHHAELLEPPSWRAWITSCFLKMQKKLKVKQNQNLISISSFFCQQLRAIKPMKATPFPFVWSEFGIV